METTPLSPAEHLPNIREVFQKTKAAIVALIKDYNYSVKSGGTTDLELKEPLDSQSGWWARSSVTGKPLRWILQIDEAYKPFVARPAQDHDGNQYSNAGTVGYLNSSDGKCISAIYRILCAVRPSGERNYEFPGWEWLLVLGFPEPLPVGTSSSTISSFSPDSGTFAYNKRNGGKEPDKYNLAFVGIVTAPAPTPLADVPSAGKTSLTYEEATEAVGRYILSGPAGGRIYHGADPASIQQLTTDLDASIVKTTHPISMASVEPDPTLIGISEDVYRQINAALSAGKRHLIFYGPPGTGKTTLAQYVARALSPEPESADAYTMLTASASWTSQDLIGGYQPFGEGRIGFIPGALLRHFDKPLVIDELNRCPIDKVIGPLFSVLSGQATTLPYRVEVEDASSAFYTILPKLPPVRLPHEYAPDSHWRLLCTLNTIDKTQLGQISYALSRRFAWIRVGVPENLNAFIDDWSHQEGIVVNQSEVSAGLIASMWSAVNTVREIGPAPVIDFARAVRAMNPAVDPSVGDTYPQGYLVDAFRMYVLPLLDGITLLEAEQITAEIANAWSLGPTLGASLAKEIKEMAV